MRPRILMYVSILILGLLALVLWQIRIRYEPASKSIQRDIQPNDGQFDNKTVTTPSLSGVNQADPGSSVDRPSKVITNNAKNRLEQIKQALEEKNVPLDFYGRIVDQDSNSLPGVKISIRVRHWDMASFGSSIPIDRETDENGRFDIHGVTGDAFDIENIEKNGYELEPTRGGYGAIGGSSTEPVVFKMWRANVHERLVTNSMNVKVIPDGRAYAIDLIKGTMVEAQNQEGDLQIWIKRPSDIQPGQKHYEWSFGIKIEKGGILPELDGNAAMFLAPADAYTGNFEWSQPATESGWGNRSGDRRFYVKIRGQLYGKITVAADAYFNGNIPGFNVGDGRLSINYAINPSGSDILR